MYVMPHVGILQERRNMKLYLAPLEGITGWIFRSAVSECYGGFDKYFVPFIRPNQMGHLSSREKKDIAPENNRGMKAVPQILTNRSDDLIRTAEKLREKGYKEINLNLGCPSRTVVTKGRGAGFLAFPERLDRFLYEVFESCEIDVSVKTRIGMEDPAEAKELIRIYNKYPIRELIIHPRLQKDFYKGKPDMEVFRMMLEESRNPVCYNGDIFCLEDYRRFREEYPQVGSIMTGRGVLADPSLGRQICGGKRTSKEELKRFHDLVYQGYCEEMSGDRTVLYKMKELWFYLAPLFTDYKKYAKKIKKSEKCVVYEAVVEELFKKEEIAGS